MPTRIEWPSGEEALLFEIHVRRPATRQLRVRGPNGVAWALFAPGNDGGWRPRSSAVATGVAGGTTHTKFGEAGVWALVLFHDAPIPRGATIEIAFDPQDPTEATAPFQADAHELRRFVLGALALATAMALGEAGRAYLETGNIWTTWLTVPLGVVVLLFPTNFAITMFWHIRYNIGVLRGEEPRRLPTFANRPLDLEPEIWPSVTIQIPIFRESFDDAIRPTLDAAREAARLYHEQTGARCNLLVCEDGLLYFARNDLEGSLATARRTPVHQRSADDVELLTRVEYYEAFDVPFVARPYPEPGVPGTERAGRFRKASNLNYALRLADRLEGGDPLSEAHAHFREMIPEHVYELGRWRGDVRIGEIIVQLDKDSLMPPDVIRATVPEFVADPTLAYTQHGAYPTNEERYFSVIVGWFTRMLYDIAISGKCLIQGSFVPLMGHNIFLRRSDLMRVGAWYEHSVCEDLELSLRFNESGSHGKYIAFPGLEFGEAVTRVYTEEVEKYRRYAFGAVEAVLNPISEWEHRGILKKSWRQFCHSKYVRWFQVLDLLQFFFSLLNLATYITLALLTGLGFVHPYRAVSMLVISLFVFGLTPVPALYLLRRGTLSTMRGGKIWATRFGVLKAIAAQFALSYAFLGASIAIIRGAFAHLFNRPIVFAATNTDDLGQASRREHLRDPSMRQAVRDGIVLLVVAGALAFWRLYLDPTYGVGKVPLDWWVHLIWIAPLVLTAISPFAFHPYIVTGRDLPRPRRKPPRRAAAARTAPGSAEWARTANRGAA